MLRVKQTGQPTGEHVWNWGCIGREWYVEEDKSNMEYWVINVCPFNMQQIRELHTSESQWSKDDIFYIGKELCVPIGGFSKPPADQFKPDQNTTKQKITDILTNMEKTLHEKNDRYGDSAVNPKQFFSKLTGEEGIKIRLDDKIGRIINSGELRKNDVFDLIGYLTLFSVTQGWDNFEDQID